MNRDRADQFVPCAPLIITRHDLAQRPLRKNIRCWRLLVESASFSAYQPKSLTHKVTYGAGDFRYLSCDYDASDY